MATSGLRGPFTLTTAGVQQAVTGVSAGAYALGHTRSTDNMFIIEYVGRSDDDVRARLLTWAPTKYHQFKYEYYTSSLAAYRKECDLFHDFGGLSLDNDVHPARPANTNLRCARCGA